MTAHKNINKTQPGRTVLIAPLDWGMGHVTRCIPLIRMLSDTGFTVTAATNLQGKIILQKEFPGLKIIDLPGYNVQYSRSRFLFSLKMALQIPKIIAAVSRENHWLKQLVSTESFNIIISDNRYGLYSKKAKCIFITHQLSIRTGTKVSDYISNCINRFFINKYNECWVPDFAGDKNLSGALSHPPPKTKTPIKYLGALSRFVRSAESKTIDVLCVISGPEPQRSIFENLLANPLKNIKGNHMFVRGVINGSVMTDLPKNITVADHMSAADLNDAMNRAEIVVARSGYSTVMDLARLQKKSILIPTPGQTEQEYLAKYLSANNYAISYAQENFDLARAIDELKRKSFTCFPDEDETLLSKAIISL